MEPRLSFSKEFIGALDSIKTDINRALIYTIHIVSSRVLDPIKKDQFCSDLASLGTELRNCILRLDVARLTEYTLREAEASFIEACELIHREFARLFDQVDRKFEVKIDPLAIFNIADIIHNLKEGSNRMDSFLTKDKIDNLLSIKTLIIDIYESQVRGTIDREKAKGGEKSLFEIKEKTFLQYLHNADNRNPSHFFKISLLLKKLMGTGNPICLSGGEEAPESGVIFVSKGEKNSIGFSYRKEVMAFSFTMASWKEANQTWYRIQGRVKDLDFSILDYVMAGTEARFEAVSGIDNLRNAYEKLLINSSRDEDEDGKNREKKKKKDIDDSLDDLLFNDE